MDIIESIEKEMMPADRKLNFEVGDTVKVHYKIIEGNKERIQAYEGVVIAIDNKGLKKTFTVRRVSYDIGVERTFPLFSPRIAKIDVTKRSIIRRAKLYYLRERTGKSSKLRENRSKISPILEFSDKKPVEKEQPASGAETTQEKSE